MEIVNSPLADDASGGKRGGKELAMDTWWEERTLAQKILFVISMTILGIVLLAVFGWVVMLLWNWLMPEIFGLGAITYWQAWGLLILTWILFKPWGMGAGNGSSDRKRKRELRKYMQDQESAQQEEQC